MATGSGPVYKFGALPKQSRVCDATKGSHYTRINPASCVGPVCLLRKTVDLGQRQPRLHVEGTLKDESCKELPHVAIDLWQADSTGRYGSLHPGEENDFCRAVILTDRHGASHVATTEPGISAELAGWHRVAAHCVAPNHVHMIFHSLSRRPRPRRTLQV